MTKTKITFCNEEKLIQEEKERLRKLRIIQVREISKQNAANLRQAFRNEKDKEVRKQLEKKETVSKQVNEENFNEIKQFVQREIDSIGSGHLSAANYDDKTELRQKKALENHERAAVRGRTAIIVEKSERAEAENKENAHIVARQNAIEQEKIRSAKIAKLPKPIDDNLENIESKKPTKLVSMHDIDAFMTTRYHMPETIVNKATSDELENFDARQSAINEELKLKNFEQDLKRQSNERNEKARLRGKYALEKEILNENYNDILKELNILQQADREKRQKELLNIPKEIFVPSWQREQDKKEFQLELEREFEKIYIDTNMRREEMPEPIDPNKIDEMKENGIEEDSELDLTVLNEDNQNLDQSEPVQLNEKFVNLKNEEKNSKIISNEDNSSKPIEPNFALNSNDNLADNMDQNLNSADNFSKNQSSKESLVLGKLLDKIKKQREELAQKSSDVNLSLEDSNISDYPTKDNDSDEQKNDKQSESLVEKSLNGSRKFESENESNVEERQSSYSNEELSYTLSLNSTPRSNVETTDKKPSLNNREKKLIKGIMMSSHNVSSVREFTLDHNRMILDSKMNSQQDFKNNAYSVDLSHASRDLMIAGPKELFNKNDVKLAIELKQKQLHKQQQELEEKLRKLEEQQNELEKQTKTSNSNKSYQNQSDSNNSLTLSHSINSNKSNRLPSENTDKLKSVDDEDNLKRIEYQKKLLELSCAKNLEKCVESENQFDKLIEDRKKEIQKKFGLEINSNSNSSLNTIKDQQLIRQKPLKAVAQCDDKHTIYSGDSGFVSSSNNYNMNLRNQQIAKKPINIAVEQLNREVFNAAKNKNSIDLFNFLNGEINEEEYRRRLSLITNQSDSSLTLTGDQISKLFGLEFYDSNNLSDVRDSSIEKLIEWSILQAKAEKETKSKSSGLYSKTNLSSASSNDTLNDQSSNDFSDNDEKSDDGGNSLILSLLKKNKTKKNDESNSLEFKKQLIQDQLEMVRRQKDQLDIQQSKNFKAFNTTSLPPPVKFNKFVNDHNLHELSTIKEVDTPISERNVKLTNSTRYQTCGGNRSSINLTTVSSMDASSSSLENVTQLNESNQVQTSRAVNLQNQNQSYGISAMSSAISPSTSLFCTTIAEENTNQNSKNNYSKSLSASSSSFTSTSTPITQTSVSKAKTDLEELKTNQRQLFNISLFNSTNKSSFSSKSNSPCSDKSQKVEYGELIFDALATNNLSVSQSSMSQTSVSNSSQKPVAFKTESTLDTSDLFKKYNLNSNNNNNNNNDNSQYSINNKKWFDILASTTDEEKSASQRKLSTSSLSQGPLLDDTLENDQESKMFSLIQIENKSSLMSASPSVLINSLDSTKMESLRDLEPENEMRSLRSCSLTSQENTSFRSDNGMFGKFLKNYNSTTGASVMDEPEISFVSCKTFSNPVSPRTAQSFSERSSNQSAESSYSLIKLQKKQLSQQFADCSSIDQPSSLSSSQMRKSLSTTIPFETTSMFKTTSSETMARSNENYENFSKTENQSDKTCESDRRGSTSSQKNESFISFYNQELTNLTPMNKKFESTVFLKSLVQSEEDIHNSTMISLKETNESNKQQSTLWNSTPMVSNSDLKFMTNQFQDSCTFENFANTNNDYTNQSASLLYFNESTNLSFARRNDIENPSCKTCAYCRSFYTIINQDSKMINKGNILAKDVIFIKNKKKEIARNVTQEFYFVDFDGKRYDLKSMKKNALQASCLVHLNKIRIKNSKSNLQRIHS